jgi:hypothetical protein
MSNERGFSFALLLVAIVLLITGIIIGYYFKSAQNTEKPSHADSPEPTFTTTPVSPSHSATITPPENVSPPERPVADPTPSSGSYNCKPGFPCAVPEDEGKIKVSNTPQVEALAKKYGWDHVHISALDGDLVKHAGFIEKVYPDLAYDTGCIIMVHAGDEGYVYREDKKLNVVYTETLAEFLERTKNFDAGFMAKFFLSMH